MMFIWEVKKRLFQTICFIMTCFRRRLCIAKFNSASVVGAASKCWKNLWLRSLSKVNCHSLSLCCIICSRVTLFDENTLIVLAANTSLRSSRMVAVELHCVGTSSASIKLIATNSFSMSFTKSLYIFLFPQKGSFPFNSLHAS